MEFMNYIFSSIAIPRMIRATPKQALVSLQWEVPAIRMPTVRPTATETRTICISFTTETMVTSMAPPQTIMTSHCQMLGTIMSVAGKNTGSPMLAMNIIQWLMVQAFDSRSLKIQEVTQPRQRPGRNSQSLEREQFSSMRREPAMMAAKQSPQVLMRCPLVNSQNMAKSMPPEPFQPMQRLRIMPAKETKQLILRRLSRGVSGRQGQSSQRLMMPMQLMRKAVRMVTKTYCRTGIPQREATRVCSTMSRGAMMTRLKLLSLICGSSFFTLQEYSWGITVGRGVCDRLSSSDSISFSVMVLLLIPIFNKCGPTKLRHYSKVRALPSCLLLLWGGRWAWIGVFSQLIGGSGYAQTGSGSYLFGGFEGEGLLVLVVVAEEVVEEDEEDDEGAHAGAVEVQLVLHYFIIYYVSTHNLPFKHLCIAGHTPFTPLIPIR